MVISESVSTPVPAAFGHSFPGDPLPTMRNPVTGDRMTPLCQQAGYLKNQFQLPPGSQGSPLHYHTRMWERFTVLEGELQMQVGSLPSLQSLKAGESLMIPPRLHHSFCNVSEDWVTFQSENYPAGEFHRFLQGLYGLAQEGKVNAEGTPTNPFYLGILLSYADTTLVGTPRWLQQSLIGVLASLGRLAGLEADLLAYWN